MADWGLGHPLDSEETALMAVLRDACRAAPPARRPLVVPPLRFIFGADPSCAFAVDPPAAHAMIAEVVASVAAAGFRRIVLLNASPWNEELCGAAARDLRVSRGLQMFVIHLSALDLDFHPQRSKSRRRLQTLLTSLYGADAEPAPEAAPAAQSWGEEPVTALGGPAVAVPQAREEGAAILAAAAARLAALLSDIRDRPPLEAALAPP
jgi:creatinine amidohydrolase/Fe(II)-dependent formamide hydrolase-like protein